MTKAQISEDFLEFESRHQQDFEDARKAENALRGNPLPIGTSGTAVIVGLTATKGKDFKFKDKETGEERVRPGNPYVRMDYRVETPEKYRGKKLNTAWSFYDSDNASKKDRYEWFLNALETHGLPREIRTTGSIKEFADFFLCEGKFDGAEPRRVEYIVQADEYNRMDGKKVVARDPNYQPAEGEVSSSASVSAASFSEGEIVEYLGGDHEVLSIKDDELKLKSLKTERERTVSLSEMGNQIQKK